MSVQFTIIDGYNLLRSVGFLRSSSVTLAPNALLHARQALLRFLNKQLEEEIQLRTTVVFDAKDSPDGLPDAVVVGGIHVVFAVQHEEADDLIEEMIKRHSAPKQLTVVSSDHRIKTAATRRNARAVDSETWFDLLTEKSNFTIPALPEDGSGSNERIGNQKLSIEETSEWIKEFDLVDGGAEIQNESNAADQVIPTDKPEESSVDSTSDNPFPQQYLDDLISELDDDP